jgi:hypothetical protein
MQDRITTGRRERQSKTLVNRDDYCNTWKTWLTMMTPLLLILKFLHYKSYFRTINPILIQ